MLQENDLSLPTQSRLEDEAVNLEFVLIMRFERFKAELREISQLLRYNLKTTVLYMILRILFKYSTLSVLTLSKLDTLLLDKEISRFQKIHRICET